MLVKKFIKNSRNLLISPQNSILSAAAVIMLMIVASRVLGLFRQRILAHFFSTSDLSLFFAAFRLPDTIFEVLVFGTFSSAFIPVFTRLAKEEKNAAWKLAASVVNVGLLAFLILAVVVSLAADSFYSVFAPGFPPAERSQIVTLTRILFAAQGFFVISYVLTGVLESLKRFFIPALAPIFYNLGIILGTLLFSGKFGLIGPAVGVLVGAAAHFLIQLPLAIRLGFRLKLGFKIDENVRKIAHLALPRMIEVSFIQISKMTELFFASVISAGSYAYYTFGNTLQLLPVGLFGTSIAKASLPTLSALAENKTEFMRVLKKSLFEMTFLITPFAALLIVLRVPIVRLVYGTDIFSWEATVQTGMVVSAFAFGIVFQAAAALLARAFYAIHDTRTPVAVSVASIVFSIVLNFLFIRVMKLPVWGLSLAFSAGAAFQACALYYLITKKMLLHVKFSGLMPFFKHILAAFPSGLIMYFFLRFFDRSAWVKRLSFLGQIEITRNIPFQKFVLDTRYTVNLLVLTLTVMFIGLTVYLILSAIFKTRELVTYFMLIRRIFRKTDTEKMFAKEKESIIPPAGETTG